MTTATPAKLTTYFVTIPIYSCVHVTLEDVPEGLSDEEVLALINTDALMDSESYPLKAKEFAFEAQATLLKRPLECEVSSDS